MKKYFDKVTHERLPVGVLIRFHYPDGETDIVKATEDLLEYLTRKGYVYSVDLDSVPRSIDYYHELIAARVGWTSDYMEGFFSILHTISPILYYRLIERLIAERIDSLYPNHIKEAPRIWGTDALTGKVKEIDKNYIKTWKHFAAFRSKEDAGIACQILKSLRAELFKKDDRK